MAGLKPDGTTPSTGAVDIPRPPPYTEIASKFGELEGKAERWNMVEVSYDLRKAELPSMRDVVLKETKETCMVDFL